MIVVVDTNAVLGAFAEDHPHRPLLDAALDGQIVWAVSTEILLEYEEILAQRSGPARATRAMHLLEAMAGAGLCIRKTPHYRWHLITADPDDDKFADCAIAAEADWLITEDAHFDALKSSGHKPQPITPADFIARFLAA
jgi:uncharacterized protein